MDRSWIVVLYRAGSLSTIRIERVKHCWLDANNTVLRIAQYDEGCDGTHHYITYPVAMLDSWREERTDPDATAMARG